MGGHIMTILRDGPDPASAMSVHNHSLQLERLKLFEEAFRSSPSFMHILRGPDLVFEFVNEAYCRLVGRHNLIGKPAFEVIPEAIQSGYRDKITHVMAMREPFVGHEMPIMLIRSEGAPPEERYIDLTYLPLIDPDGACTRVLGSGTDVTEHVLARRRAEDALQNSNKYFRKLFEQDAVGIALTRTGDGQLVAINQKYCSIVGYTQQEMRMRSFKSITHPEDLKKDLDNMRLLVEGHVPKFTIEKRYIHQNGSIVWVNLTVVPMWSTGETADFHLAVVEDITERKRAERALRQSEKRLAEVNVILSAVLDHTYVLAAYLDTQFNFIWVNRAYAETDDHEPGFFAGKNHFKLYPHPENQAIFQRVVDTGEPYFALARPFEYPEHPERGTKFWDWGLIPVKESDGTVGSLVLTLTEVTERIRADQEKAKIQEQLTQSQKMESTGRLAGGIAHDFNNMLGVILGRAEMALQTVPPDQPVFEDLSEIQKAAKRSSDLTQQLLAFARRQTVAPRVLDLNATIAGMIRMLERMIGENISIQWKPVHNLWPVKVDPSQVDQIIVNLCVNARDAIGGLGQITITTGNTTIGEARSSFGEEVVPGEYVWFAVEDNGHGMDKEVLDHIFEPFFTTKAVGVGTGLGLSMVYGAVQQNKGFIEVNSEVGQGTVVRVHLPHHREVEAHVEPAEDNEPQHGSQTILLVEDEQSILTMIEKVLKNRGYTVLAASGPTEAIQIAKEHSRSIHLLLTDLIMPEMNGRNLSAVIQAIYPEIKCLFMSGYTADIINQDDILSAGHGFIQKPFSVKTLARTVAEVLAAK